ncbi:hypothetical protein [Nicoliella lavandulae]|uniref:Glycosyltransferase family 39 protein n=1 Tax=Nicoliella lavandulae TaxID=3082954 RepID=A0ABU8SJW7_9LACO
MNNQIKQRLNWAMILLTAGISLFITAFITTTSPLFAFNNSWDGNTMFTVGKGLWHGLMPYRDLFDQRGPLIYLMNSFAALISYRTFLGVYLFEAITIFFDIVFAYQIINLKFKTPIAYAASLAFIPIVFNSYYFENGELPESLLMPLLLSLIYSILKSNGKLPSNWQLYGQGIALALVFWTKYSLIWPWVAFFGLVAIQSIHQHDWHELWRRFKMGGLGFLSISGPLIIFYGIMGALVDLFKVYFFINIHFYPSSGLFSPRIILNIAEFVFQNGTNLGMSILLILGTIYLIRLKSIDRFAKQLILSGLGLEIIFIVGNEFSFRYYYVGLGAYFVFLCMGIASLLDQLINHSRFTLNRISIIGTIIALGATFITNTTYRDTILFPHNQSISTNHKDTVPFQIQFANIINRSHDKSILNYDNLDVGLYTATATLPQSKYFAKLNLQGYAPMMGSQNEILKNHQAHFVVLTLLPHETVDDLIDPVDPTFQQAYQLVAQRDTVFQNHEMTYLLYELRS